MGMTATSTLIELINASALTPLTARDVLAPFIRTHFRELKKQFVFIFLDSTSDICVTNSNEFSSYDEIEKYSGDLPGRFEFLRISFDGLVLEVAMRTRMICWVHHFDDGSDYQYSYHDDRMNPDKVNEKESVENLEAWVVKKILTLDR